jgi:hypothetical protein
MNPTASPASNRRVVFPRKRDKISLRFLKVLRGFIASWGAACDLFCPTSRLLLRLVPRRGF